MFSRKSRSNVFKARSIDRDVATDAARLAAISGAIDKALAEADAEKAGLARRLADVVARASLTFGNETDEYLTRDPLSDAHQSELSAEIKYAEGRLQKLESQIGRYRTLKAAAEELS